MTTFESYLASRKSLIETDWSLRVDLAPKRRSVTSSEGQADAIVRQIRAREAEMVWGLTNTHNDIVHPFPGMEFLTAKDVVIRTKVFKLLQKMPKGALLHVHMNTVSMAFLLSIALEYPAYHINVPHRLTSSSLATTVPKFWAFPESQYPQHCVESVTDEKYEPGRQWVSLQKARENFSKELGGKDGFDKWVVGAMSISPKEAYDTHNTIEKIWQKFDSSFIPFVGLALYSPVFTRYVREFITSSIADGISYMELRIVFTGAKMVDPEGNPTLGHADWLQIIDDVIKEVKGDLSKDGRSDEFVGLKVIYNALRFWTNEQLTRSLDDCVEMKKRFPHLICGFDLVGEETLPKSNPLVHYAPTLLSFQARCAAEGLDIPFLFHAGETVGDGTKADDNLYDAVLLGSKRIGHGYSLMKHPELIRLCRERGICIEVCPISNEILRLTSSTPAHPLFAMLAHGVPLALSSDDPGLFGNAGLTFDFYQVLVSSELCGLITLRELCRTSLEHAMLDPKEKARALEVWERRWQKYVDWIIKEADGEGGVLR